MEYRLPGTRQIQFSRYSNTKHGSYDYKYDGILTKVLPSVITSTKNKTTRIALDLVENSAIFLLQYVDVLKHFKNWNYRLY